MLTDHLRYVDDNPLGNRDERSLVGGVPCVRRHAGIHGPHISEGGIFDYWASPPILAQQRRAAPRVERARLIGEASV